MFLISHILAITNPKVPPGTADSVKRFNFDYSYWSHDVSIPINHFLVTPFYMFENKLCAPYELTRHLSSPLFYQQFDFIARANEKLNSKAMTHDGFPTHEEN